MFATINIIELTATDLAYYKNVEEFQKRYMQIHAPSMKFNTEANVLYGSKHSINGNVGTSFPEEDLNALFGIKRMQSLLQQVYEATKKQLWRRSIDELFE